MELTNHLVLFISVGMSQIITVGIETVNVWKTRVSETATFTDTVISKVLVMIFTVNARSSLHARNAIVNNTHLIANTSFSIRRSNFGILTSKIRNTKVAGANIIIVIGTGVTFFHSSSEKIRCSQCLVVDSESALESTPIYYKVGI